MVVDDPIWLLISEPTCRRFMKFQATTHMLITALFFCYCLFIRLALLFRG